MPKERKNKVRYHARPISFETVNTEKYLCGMTQITAYRHIKRLIAKRNCKIRGLLISLFIHRYRVITGIL